MKLCGREDLFCFSHDFSGKMEFCGGWQNFRHVELSSHHTSKTPTRLPGVSCFILGILFNQFRCWEGVEKCGERGREVCRGVGKCGERCERMHGVSEEGVGKCVGVWER